MSPLSPYCAEWSPLGLVLAEKEAVEMHWTGKYCSWCACKVYIDQHGAVWCGCKRGFKQPVCRTTG